MKKFAFFVYCLGIFSFFTTMYLICEIVQAFLTLGSLDILTQNLALTVTHTAGFFKVRTIFIKRVLNYLFLITSIGIIDCQFGNSWQGFPGHTGFDRCNDCSIRWQRCKGTIFHYIFAANNQKYMQKYIFLYREFCCGITIALLSWSSCFSVQWSLQRPCSPLPLYSTMPRRQRKISHITHIFRVLCPMQLKHWSWAWPSAGMAFRSLCTTASSWLWWTKYVHKCWYLRNHWKTWTAMPIKRRQ